MKSLPLCSIIILNYQGENVIKDCLNAIWNLNYPKNRLEVIVVDNNSKDKSQEILSELIKDHPDTKVILLNKNIGFSRGNNVGINEAQGEFVALINNDCLVDKNWLKEVVKVALSDKKIFAVNPKILLYPKHFLVKFEVDPRFSPVLAWLTKSELYDGSESKIFYLSLMKGTAYHQIELQYEPFKDKTVEFCISFSSRGRKVKENNKLQGMINFVEKQIKVLSVSRNGDDIEYHLSLDVTDNRILRKSLDKIQSAGIMIFQDGYGRDIGAVVSSNQQYYEYDLKQYENQKEVYAACGAVMLMNKKILDKIGHLNENFFMYYEDVEICERARFAGYKTVYSPKGTARHYHALFSKEWSPFFVYHVEKGRLLHVLYNYPFRVFLSTFYDLTYDCILNFLSIFFRIRGFIYKIKTKQVREEEPKFVRRIQIIRALLFFFLMAPVLAIDKIRINNTRKGESVEDNYKRILQGEWYFK